MTDMMNEKHDGPLLLVRYEDFNLRCDCGEIMDRHTIITCACRTEMKPPRFHWSRGSSQNMSSRVAVENGIS
jgi:hypothetical protein